MKISPRFRDIFSSDPIATRVGDTRNEAARETLSDAEFDRRTGELQIDLIWLEIAHAHQRAARAFTPDSVYLQRLSRGRGGRTRFGT